MSAGDFDLAVAPDGKAYYYFERVHSETICADLTDDYNRRHPATTAPTSPTPARPMCERPQPTSAARAKHYLVTSGTTGYLPNPSEVAIADTWHGPYTVLGDPHPTDPSHTSFHSQISSVYPGGGQKGFVHRRGGPLVPQDMDVPYDFTREMFEYLFQGRREEIPALAERYGIQRPAGDRERDTSIADYVWLPFRFEGDRPYLDWHDEWCIEDYE